MIRSRRAAFTDGVVDIYGTENMALPGGKPAMGRGALKYSLRFMERTVGVNRYYRALQSVGEIERLIRCPAVPGVCAHDVAAIGKSEYEIVQVQMPEGARGSMDLSLARKEGA